MLTVETGEGVVDVESLCSVIEADLYHEVRGNTGTWNTLDTERKEQLLRDAFDYLRGEYRSRWPATAPFGTAAGLVPRDMKFASARLALKAKAGALDPEIKPQKLESEVGPIKAKYAATASPRRIFPDIAALVEPYLATAGASPFMVRLERN